MNTAKVDQEGNVALGFNHASDYVVVMSDEEMSQASVPEDLQPDNKEVEEDTDKDGDGDTGKCKAFPVSRICEILYSIFFNNTSMSVLILNIVFFIGDSYQQNITAIISQRRRISFFLYLVNGAFHCLIPFQFNHQGC